MFMRELKKMRHLLVSQNIACGVGWTGNSDRTNFVRDRQTLKVHVILELTITYKFDGRPVGVKKFGAHSDVGIADVFRCERQKDLSFFALYFSFSSLHNFTIFSFTFIPCTLFNIFTYAI